MKRSVRKHMWLGLSALLILTWCLSSGVTLAYREPDAAQRPAPDMDSRGSLSGGQTESTPATSPALRQALDSLQSAVPDLTVRWSVMTGAPNRLYSLTQPLTNPTTASPRDIALSFVQTRLGLFNLTSQDVAETRFSRDFLTSHNGVTHLTIQQQVNGIDVFGSLMNVNVDAQGRVVSVAGELMPGVGSSLNTPTPVLTSDAAIGLAATGASVTSARNTRSEGLVYFPQSTSSSRLAWDVTVEDAQTPNVYRTIVDAVDGTLLWRQNLTYYSHVAAHGPVFTSDSPSPNSPTGTGTGQIARVDADFESVLFPHADPHADWWNGGPDPTRTVTRSNNVFAHNDRDNDNDDSEGFPPAVAGENFTFPLAFPIVQTVNPSTYTDAATVNLFYGNNVAHDRFYRLGFDEASGNFQVNNFGLGGAGNDPVQADSQDDAADPNGARCNANFGTPADGTSPRMQMYICTRAGGNIQDGDFDADVFFHEYTHGVHSRLVPTLTGGQQGGMSEGWSDFFALSFLSEPGDDLSLTWRVGRWLFFPGGIRRQPYDATQTFYTRTYADIVDGSNCSILTCSNNPSMPCTLDSQCGAGNTCNARACSFDFQCQPPQTTINQGTCQAEVHNTGELWAETLWIARANMVNKYGFATGGQTMLQDVIDGMKLSAPMPDFLDSRDAILLADLVNNNGVNQCLLWDAFAKMGLGVSALSTGPNDINPIEAFDTPAICTPNIQVSGPLDFGTVCMDAFKNNQLEIFNTGTGDLIVNSINRVLGSSLDISLESNPTFPVFISADAHVDFNIRCEPTLLFGSKTTTFRIDTNDPDQPTIDLVYTCDAPRPVLDTLIADSGNFGDVCLGTFKDLDLTLNNSGVCDLSVSNITSSSAEFERAQTLIFPVVVGPGTSLEVPIRLNPATLGAKSAVITVSSDALPGDRNVNVSGNVPPGDIRVTGSTDFGDVCAGTLAEKTVSVCNVGHCNLEVTSVAFEPACPDFTLINNPFPATVSPDSCEDVVIRFTPTSAGPKSCTLVIRSDDPDSPVISKTVTANTPAASIDVPPDLGFAPTVIQSVGSCTTGSLFPVSNTGTCPLTITELGITANPDEFSLSGVPSFPILLEQGHIAGEGDLSAVFAPDILDRDDQGQLRVTWVSDAITGATTSVTRDLCGEGVRTGARVLVKAAGVPLLNVVQIKLQRINANRNKNLLDTVDTSKNLTLQTVNPASPCAPFQYHKEYSTVSNPIQLLPGSYQVTVTAIVNGKRQHKTVGFDVTTCGFNPNIVVNF